MKLKTRHKFPESTVGVYLPGVGMTITRANIEEVQKQRVKDGKQKLNGLEIASTFTFPSHPRQDWTPERRHVNRANNLS